MASLAEYERELIRERTNAGLQSARARGRLGGRPKGYNVETISKLLLLRNIYKDVTKRPEEIYKPFGLTRATFFMLKFWIIIWMKKLKIWELKNKICKKFSINTNCCKYAKRLRSRY